MKAKIMYLECKTGPRKGEARICRVTFTNTNRLCTYGEQTFRNLRAKAGKSNFCDAKTEAGYWITSPRKSGSDRLPGSKISITIDEDVQEEYWKDIRDMPEMVGTLIRPGA
jgi:hypothetical protein